MKTQDFFQTWITQDTIKIIEGGEFSQHKGQEQNGPTM